MPLSAGKQNKRSEFSKLVFAHLSPDPSPLKKTISMPIKKTIDEIYKTANLKVIGIRRII